MPKTITKKLLPDEDDPDPKTPFEEEQEQEDPEPTNEEGEDEPIDQTPPKYQPKPGELTEVQKELLQVAQGMSKGELVRSEILLRHPELRDQVMARFKDDPSRGLPGPANLPDPDAPRDPEAVSFPNYKPLPKKEDLEKMVSEGGKLPDAVYEQTDPKTGKKQTAPSPDQARLAKDRIERLKDLWIEKVASDGKTIVHLYYYVDDKGDTVWLKLPVKFRDVPLGIQKLVRTARAKVLDITRQLEVYDALRAKLEPTYNHLYEEYLKAHYSWMQLTAFHHWGVPMEDFDMISPKDAYILGLAAEFQENNIYPNFQSRLNDSFIK